MAYYATGVKRRESYGSKLERIEQYSDITETCWLFNGAKSMGYGQLRTGGKVELVHRIVWEELNGDISDGLMVLHKCDVRNCWNPDHLFLGTAADNTHDMESKGREGGRWSTGRGHPSAKLSAEDVQVMRKVYAEGKFSMKDIAAVFEVDKETAWRVINRVSYRDVD